MAEREEAILVQDRHEPGILRLRLNRPSRLNAIDRHVFEALRVGLITAETDPQIRVVVVTGTGRAFSSGGDLKATHAEKDTVATSPYAQTHLAWSIFGMMEWLGKPILSAVNGLAYAAGLAVVLCSDLTIASESATFCVPEAKRGLLDPYMPGRIAARIGMERAKYMMFTGEPISASQALEWGLISRVVPPERLETASLELAAQVAACSPFSLRGYKHMARRTLAEFDAGTYLQAPLAAEAMEGVRGFALDKR